MYKFLDEGGIRTDIICSYILYIPVYVVVIATIDFYVCIFPHSVFPRALVVWQGTRWSMKKRDTRSFSV